ncbi:MAG: class I SAM-dependent methyltransferase [Acidobacteriota bacterium]
MLTHAQARRFYDWFGARQDLQRVYEDHSIDVLVAHSAFDRARAVVELGCGTGRLAERLLRTRLPADATYVGLDISQTMVDLAREHVRPWRDRADVRLGDGSLRLPLPDRSCDRFVSTYVLDLLTEDDIRTALDEAHRVLVPGGRLCLASLTFGQTAWSRALCRLWTHVHARHPMWVGGCRPLELTSFFDGRWDLQHQQVVCTLGICTEVVVASPS